MTSISRFSKFATLCAISSMSMGAGGTSSDNSKKNEERTQAQLQTADDASQSEGDVKTTAAIRRDLVKRDELSTYAKNIKIIIHGGSVRLAGPVRSAAEKEIVLKVAKAEAPQLKIVDEITITNAQK